jgi:hypothetical protein
VDVTMIGNDGRVTPARLVLRDRAGPQKFAVRADQIVTVRLTFRSAHGMARGRFMAVGELEFFARG